jgi:uncharacterized protein YciI
MSQFICRLEPMRIGMLSDAPTEREAEIVGQHFAYLKQLADAGEVLLAGRTLTTDERTFGVVVFVADSEARARQLVADDPAVRHGVMRAELLPFRVALWSDRWPRELTNDRP